MQWVTVTGRKCTWLEIRGHGAMILPDTSAYSVATYSMERYWSNGVTAVLLHRTGVHRRCCSWLLMTNVCTTMQCRLDSLYLPPEFSLGSVVAALLSQYIAIHYVCWLCVLQICTGHYDVMLLKSPFVALDPRSWGHREPVYNKSFDSNISWNFPRDVKIARKWWSGMFPAYLLVWVRA